MINRHCKPKWGIRVNGRALNESGSGRFLEKASTIGSLLGRVNLVAVKGRTNCQ